MRLTFTPAPGFGAPGVVGGSVAVPLPLDGELHAALQRYGYAPPIAVPPREIVKAFQRHFRPARVDGMADPETRTLLAALLDPLGGAL